MTRLLECWRAGDEKAFQSLLPLVLSELRVLAERYLKHCPLGSDHLSQGTQPTLIHSAYLRLVDQTKSRLESQAWFFAVAAQAMREILVAYAWRHQNERRMLPYDRMFFGEFSGVGNATRFAINHSRHVLEVHEALCGLGEFSPRLARLVELRYFGGLTDLEVAEVLAVDLPTVEREWKVARLWLYRRLAHVG